MTQLLRFDPSASFLPRTGIDEVELAGLEYSLGQLRDSVCASASAASESDFLFYPEQLLEEYQRLRIDSELGRMLAVTKAMMFDVDRVLVIGGNADRLIAQALLDGCCQPYFNQLSRGERGSRPRIYIEGAGLDSDNLQGLLHLLGAQRDHRSTGVEDSWSIVAIRSESLHTGTRFAFEQFRRGLSASCGDEQEAIDRRLIYITAGERAASSPEAASTEGAGTEGASTANFFVSPRSHLQGTPFSAVGLIPAALMGINVMRLLEGAAAINAHFRTARPSENMVLKYAGINHLLEQHEKAQVRVFNTWNPALESVGKWYEQLLRTQLGGMVPVTQVSPRDTLVRMPKNERKVSRVIHHVIAESVRFDALPVVNEAHDPEVPLGPLSELLAASMESTAQHLLATGTPATNMYLPRVDEYYLGQYFQMMLLATQIESRL